MPKRIPKGPQLPTLPRQGNLFQASFDLNKLDQFVTGLGIQFAHYKAMPSPFGLKDKGDYRRPDGPDTLSSNGFLYKKSGCFTAAMVGNSTGQRRGESAIVDDSTSRIVLPRFYDKNGEPSEGQRIYLAPGDRIYIADPNADVLVTNYEKMEFESDQHNRPMFPIERIEFIEDSRGISYQEGLDFSITTSGDICWLAGGSNPGIDPDTKLGRIYAIRYLYKAFFYIVQLPNEVRITNITNNGIRSPERMPLHAVIQREYIYHNTIKSQISQIKQEDTRRETEQPLESTGPNDYQIKVNMGDFSEE